VIRLLLADDQALVRTGFRMILEVESDLQVVGEAQDGEEAVQLAEQLEPDVVLMDLNMPRTDGVEATRRITRSRVLVVTTFDDDARLAGALRAGACGFLLKSAPAEELVAAVRAVAEGKGALSPELTHRVIAGFASGGAVPDPAATALVERLTERERQVLVLMARGLSNAEIGQRLFVGAGTAKTHVAHILSKLGARDRVAAVVLAYEAGVVAPDGSDRGEP
jgi:DNA-binding NarL/FixJ family response regulator